MMSKWVIAISLAIAALMVLPQALALDVGFSVPGGSTNLEFSSTPGTSIAVQNTGTANGLASSGALIAGNGELRQYFEWVSTDGLAKAAAYAYLEDSESYTYDFNGGNTPSSAWASLKFTATNTNHFLLGGFACNPSDYAGTFVSGESAGTISYQNSLYASTSKVTAAQSFYGTNFADLEAAAWAERGYLDNEYGWSKANGYGADPFDTGEWHPDPGYWYGSASTDALASEQYIWMDYCSIIKPGKPYKAAASLDMDEATSFQFVTINVADEDTEAPDDNTDDVEFYDWSDLGGYYDEDNGYNVDELYNTAYLSAAKAITAPANASRNAGDWEGFQEESF
jgi:hypothetical protein